uniref:Uncharacterized protein n=1 Tax=viral metagenome TaxID=1070528 RepID=A0A6C0EPF6_9ZZZZ
MIIYFIMLIALIVGIFITCITPTEKINGTRLFIFIHSITMF